MLLCLAGPLAFAPAARAGAHEQIRRFDADIVIDVSGTVVVTETIEYDFGSATDRHGIFRRIPTRGHYDDRFDRLTPITVLSVRGAAPDTPEELQVTSEGGVTTLRIGDPNRTVSGVHTFEITYRVEGAINGFEEHAEVSWNALGHLSGVPVSMARARVTTPGGIERIACYAGPEGSRRACEESTFEGREARFAETSLAPGWGLTVVVAMPPGTLRVPDPILEERWSLSRAFSITPLTVGVSAMLTLIIVFGLGRVAWSVGRDRRWEGSVVDRVFGNDDGDEEIVPLSFGGPTDPVEFEPPEGIRPGQVGTLVDEVANPLDVTATIIHFAVRGYIRIEEIPKKGFFSKPDWLLHKLKGSDGLRGYEKVLFSGLFQSGDEVELSSLKTKFSSRLERVQRALYDDMVEQRWFAGRPDKIRTRWVAIGVALLGVAGLATVVLAALTHFALLGVPLVVGAVMVLVMSQKMPRRTPQGVAMVRRVFGFRRFIVESEAERARFAERANLFSEYLPYAVVFGVADKWAKTFEGLEVSTADATSRWYVSSEPFTMARFSSAMDSFAVSAAGTISAAAPSASSGSSGFSGGGFSGGGFGGGSTGSW